MSIAVCAQFNLNLPHWAKNTIFTKSVVPILPFFQGISQVFIPIFSFNECLTAKKTEAYMWWNQVNSILKYDYSLPYYLPFKSIFASQNVFVFVWKFGRDFALFFKENSVLALVPFCITQSMRVYMLYICFTAPVLLRPGFRYAIFIDLSYGH